MKNCAIGLFSSLMLLPACQGNVAVEGALPKDMARNKNVSVDVSNVVTISSAENALEIDSAQMLLSEFELEGLTEASEFEAGPQILELSLDGAPTQLVVSNVPAGTYREFGFQIDLGSAVNPSEAGDFGGDNPASIVVEGNYDGEPFSYRSKFAAELEFGIGKKRVRDGQTTSLTVTFDVAAWFLGPDGNLLDPSDPANGSIIDGNIYDSVATNVEAEDGDDDD